MKAVAAILAIAAVIILLSGCAAQQGPKACTAEAKICPDGSAVGRAGPNCEFSPCPGEGGNGAQIANPASVYCAEQGYKSKIAKNADGSEYGLCAFPDGSSCDEWAFYEGNCTYGLVGENMTSELCKSSGGSWNGCASACRNQTDATVCTLQCVQECECGGIAGFRCPPGYSCTDYVPAGAADAMGVCRQVTKISFGLPKAGGNATGIANPASVDCVGRGFRSDIRNGTGYCVFPDGTECEEWALYRGECRFNVTVAAFPLPNANGTKN